MIPQLIARIDTPRSSVSALVHQVITDFGKHHPQALLYPLTVAAKSSDKSRSTAAEKLLNKMREHSPVLVSQAATVSKMREHSRVGIQFVVPLTTFLVPNSRNCLSLCVKGGTK